MSSVVFEFGRVGWGRIRTPLLPGIALGLVRVTWCRGWLLDAIRRRVG